MLTVSRLHKAFGAQVVFDDAQLQLNAGDRLALMGPNGAGKSTLLKMVRGLDFPDDGTISFPRGIRIGYLPQETADMGEGTVLQETLAATTSLDDISERRSADAKKILMGLGFRLTDFDRPAAALSGGWRMRVAIARLLLQEPDLMLLDEPTNHLDLASLLWFQDYLKKIKCAILFISHDRAFVNAIAHGILDLRDHRLYRYNGDYEHYLSVREMEREQQIAAYKKQQREIADAEEFIRRFRAQAAKAPQVQSRIKMLDKLERLEPPPEIRHISIRFPQPSKTGVKILSLKGVAKSYGEVTVYNGLDFELERGQRVALVGPNGAGKSTLLKLLAGVIPLDGGERVLGLNVESGYFSQHRWETLTPGRTVLQEATATRRMNPDLFVRTVLGTFLFRDDAVFKRVEVLSGGEKSRLALAKLLLDPPNLLLLDEPTTHLDMASVEALVGALREFEGTLCFISHDLYFVNALANHVAHVEGGRVQMYSGNHDDFVRLAARREESAVSQPEPREVRSPVTATSGPAWLKTSSADLKALRQAERDRAKERKRHNARLRELETDATDLTAQLGSVFIQSDYKKLMEVDGELKKVQVEIARLKSLMDSPEK